METITSTSNIKVQWLRNLVKDKKARDTEGLYVAEGANLVRDTLSSCISQYCLTERALAQFGDSIDNSKPIILVSDKVMASISDTESAQGIMAVCNRNNSPVDCMGITVVADNISDPGNLGSIIRSMIACGVKNLLLYGDCVDVYSPKVVRASMGGISRLNIAKLADPKFLPYEHILVLDMNGENIYDINNSELEGCFALVVGSEAHGISEAFRTSKSRIISLPMIGEMESLNAAISLSVALYQLIFGTPCNS